MKKIAFRILTLVILILPIYLTFFANKNPVKSAPVTNLRDQLSSAQLSFFARMSGYNGTIFRIGTSANPSITNANLATGDTLAIADIGVTTQGIYIVRDVTDTSSIELTTGIGSTTTTSYVVATRSAIHTISFTPQTTSAGEKWQFLIRAASRTGENPSDGMPDQTGFDIGADVGTGTTGIGTRIKAADVTCPFGVGLSATSIGTTTIITSSMTSVGNTGVYHVIECTLAAGTTSTTTVGTTGTFIIGRALTVGSQLINPSPGLNHVAGQANNAADTYTYAIRQLDSTGTSIVDTTFGKLAVTESVRVTAIVDPTITFTIGTSNSTAVGTTRCGSPIGNGAVNSSPTAISFGPLVLATYNNLAQSLQCTTNSANGYVIQAYENRPMTMLGTAITLPNTTCNGGGCTSTVAAAWSTYTTSGFGYSLEVGYTSPGAAVTMGIATAGQYKSFGIGNGNAQILVSRTDVPSGTDSIYICYRTVASTTQQAGTYENSVSFIATAKF